MSEQELGILTNIKIKGFKSIKELDLDLKPINIIIGQNGAGKSNFIGVFKLLYNIVNKDLQFYIKKSGGAERLLFFGSKVTKFIDIEINFKSSNKYELTLVPAVPDRLIFNKEIARFMEKGNWDDLENKSGDESELDSGKSPYKAPYIKKYLQGVRVYHFHDVGDNSPIKKTCDLSNNNFFDAQGENLPAMLYRFKENYSNEYEKIVFVIKMVAPFFQDFILEPDDNKNILLKWKHKGGDRPFDVNYLSDGTLRFIALATLLLQPDEFIPHTILIDEPELGLHPYALKVLAELFKGVAKRGKQIIATSQSVEFVNEFSAEDIIIADRKDDMSVLRRLGEKEVEQWLEEFSIGDIWSRNIIGGNPNDF